VRVRPNTSPATLTPTLKASPTLWAESFHAVTFDGRIWKKATWVAATRAIWPPFARLLEKEMAKK
jgi:hypothetical protein